TYFIILIGIGWIASRKTEKKPEDYFLANRTFGSLTLFFTLAATNFSAFTFLGFAGAAYRYGFGQYGIMAVGTALMPIMFYIMGRKIWLLGKEHGYITPPELIGARLNSRGLRLLVLLVMVSFTIPYLAIQAVGAGILLSISLGIGMKMGASITMIVIALYVILGGMRGSGWTDVVQGVIMVTAMLLAVIFVSNSLGGFEDAGLLSFNNKPELFERPGGGNYFTPQIWFSFMLLWIFVDPMFPQLFSRFYTAGSQKSLRHSMILYPLLISFLFLIPVLIGVWAHGADIDLGGNIDMVLPLMVKNYAPPWVFTVVIVGAIAALMSTADSQLLSLSTMLTRDLELGNEIRSSKIVTLLLTFFALIFVWFGFDPKAGIFSTLVATTFSGLVVLFPTTFAVLYFKKISKWACILSIICGELSIYLFRTNILPTFGFLDGILALAIASIVLITANRIST
ncbi:MAG: sodium:solute symporter family protein, partial [Candidatus Altiarchaeales archaeon]|nr:sodium:solute symporter family protein [Candidatus Altiarchaeales archaeon]